ncbi:uncharacterized protein [Miscanthus floridulus]|uniref:uncharacterized protein n=1 Tax=Miscanthus floridulus TaxID=154761 RepID=UPI003457F1CE
MAAMFTIDFHPTYVLFDSGASHSFMSMGFALRKNISLMAISIAYRISTLGAQLCVNTRMDTVGLVLATHTYHLQFMVLLGQGIDAILRMNWLCVYGVVLDLKQRVVELWLPASEGRMSLLMPSDLALPIAAHVEASPNLASISVVCVFLDVFPEDLPGLPLDRDVEFSIELEPSTAPISRCLYRMASKKLADS